MRKLKSEEINRLSIEQFKTTEKLPVAIVLDNIRSHHNTGAIFRTCDAFACARLLLCGITGIPPHREIQKTALGACETVEWNYYASTIQAIEELKTLKYKIISLEITDNSILLDDIEINNNEKIALVLGNEINGVQEDIIKLCDTSIEIPQYGTKHSLNVAVSAGIAIWHITNKMRK